MKPIFAFVLFAVLLGCAPSFYPMKGAEKGVTQTGEATYYSATGAGNCSYPKDQSTPLLVAAMNAVDYDSSNVCGMCIEVTGPNGKVTVRIVDQCPECKKGDVDLSKDAFSAIAQVSAGRVKVSWNSVACATTGPIGYRLKEGSNAYWTAIQPFNHRFPIAKLEVMKQGQFVAASRESYNYFVLNSGVGANAPFQVRVTSSTEVQLVDTLNTPVGPAEVSGKANF